MLNKKIIALLAVPAFALVLAGCSFPKFGANQENGPDQKNGQRKAPTEMTSSCQGKSEGDSCEATMPAPPSKDGSASSSESKKITGTCKKSQDSQLICMGSGEPQGQGSPQKGNPPAKPDSNN